VSRRGKRKTVAEILKNFKKWAKRMKKNEPVKMPR
jgi:hypothetical protein